MMNDIVIMIFLVKYEKINVNGLCFMTIKIFSKCINTKALKVLTGFLKRSMVER